MIKIYYFKLYKNKQVIQLTFLLTVLIILNFFPKFTNIETGIPSEGKSGKERNETFNSEFPKAANYVSTFNGTGKDINITLHQSIIEKGYTAGTDGWGLPRGRIIASLGYNTPHCPPYALPTSLLTSRAITS